MKHIIYLILLCVCLTSCNTQIKDFAVISGTIDAKDVDSLVLTNRATDYMKTIKINNGSFKDTIVIDKIKSYSLNAGNQSYNIYLDNNYNLNLNIDKDLTRSSITFSGNGSATNNYYKQKDKFFMESDAVKGIYDMAKINKSPAQDYLTGVNTISDSLSIILNNAKIDDENFIALEKENIFWGKILHTVSYHYMKELEVFKDTTKTYTPDPDFLPQEFLNFKPDNDNLYINSKNYRLMATSIPNRLFFFKSQKIKTTDENIKLFDSIYNTIDNSYVKEDFLKAAGARLIASRDPETAKTYLDYFTSISLNEKTSKAFVNQYESAQVRFGKMQGLSRGVVSPKFVDYENFAGGTTSLDDLKGKFVYIDVWATWCGPCKKEIPFLQEVEKKYHDKNIAFVSISVDKKTAYKKWREMVEDKQLGGIQLFANNDFNSQFVKDYIITGIPRFILIDPEGKIVNASAPRPSDPKLIELFAELDI